MTVPTVNVTLTVCDITGAAVPNATVTAQLTGLDLYNAVYVSPNIQTFITDVNGLVTMPLFPNALGQKNTRYQIKGVHPTTGQTLLNVTVFVPNFNCDVSAIAGNSPASQPYPLPSVQPYSSILTQIAGGVQTFSAALISYIQTGIAAVSRTVEGKIRENVRSVLDDIPVALHAGIKDGTNTTSLLTYIRASISNAVTGVYFPEGTYYVGALGATAAFKVFDLTSKGAGFRIHTQGKVIIKGSTGTNVEQSYFFYLGNNSDFYSDPIQFQDDVVTLDAVQRGGIGFYISADNAMTNINLPMVKTKDMLAGVICVGGSPSVRIAGVNIGTIRSSGTLYPLNCQNNGDDISADLIHCTDCLRPYLFYGITGHVIGHIVNLTPRSSTGAVNISRSVGGGNTTNVKIGKYTSRGGTTAGLGHILVNHIDTLGGTISGIEIGELNITALASYYPLRFVNYTGIGGSETSGASTNVVTDVRIGRCILDANANTIDTVAAYTDTTGRVEIGGNSHTTIDATTVAAFNHFALVWTSASNPQPAIGNATNENWIRYANGRAKVSMKFVMGNTTTFGTNGWSFMMPFTAAETVTGSAWVLDSGTAFFTGVCKMNKGANTLNIVHSGAANVFTSALPMTWTTSDELYLSIDVPVLSVP